MSIKIAVIADLHFSEDTNPAIPARQGHLADIFLLRTIHRLNRYIKPDVTLILGDLLDEPDHPNSIELLQKLKTLCDKLESPYIAIPGNHDPVASTFYSVFDEGPNFTDIKGVRFLPFLDNEAPGYNASRSDIDIAKFARARKSFEGQIVSLHHVPLFPLGKSKSPYNYLNAEEIIAEMSSNGANLAISGHFHEGFDVLESDGISFFTAPALCETPFRFIELDLDNDGNIATKYHTLKNPEQANLIDYHIHTSLAYCNENMDMLKAVELGKAFGLAKVGFGEHTGHLYFDHKTYYSGRYLLEGIQSKEMTDRANDYFENYNKIKSDYTLLGMEADCDYSGRLIIKPEHKKKAQVILGAVHNLSSCNNSSPEISKVMDEFLFINDKFLKSGIKILAHPFRVFRRSGFETPECLFKPMIKMLKENNVAPEINYHTNDPSVEFFSMCINEGIKLSLGSDSHNLYEIGEFYPHMELIRRCGYGGDIKDIIVSEEEILTMDQ